MEYIKFVGAGAVALIIFLGFQYVSNLQKDNKILTANNAKLTTSNKTLTEQVDTVKKDLEHSQNLVIELNKRYDEIEERHKEVIRIFSDHDFAKLYQAKPNLIIKKMNKATDKIFKEIEDATK